MQNLKDLCQLIYIPTNTFIYLTFAIAKFFAVATAFTIRCFSLVVRYLTAYIEICLLATFAICLTIVVVMTQTDITWKYLMYCYYSLILYLFILFLGSVSDYSYRRRSVLNNVSSTWLWIFWALFLSSFFFFFFK